MSLWNYTDIVQRMAAGESIVRIGPIWYGLDRDVTVANLSYFANKNVKLIPVLRTDAAMSFSSSSPPIDTIQMELVVHYKRFATHVQKLFALTQIMPVIPVQNPVIAAIVQPIERNRRVYMTYGHSAAREINMAAGGDTGDREIAMKLYSSVPVQMRVDNIHLESISGASRDLRIILRTTRVLTANTYGDRVEYLKDMKSVVDQSEYLEEITTPKGNIYQMQSIAQLLGVDVSKMTDMLDSLRERGKTGGSL